MPVSMIVSRGAESISSYYQEGVGLTSKQTLHCWRNYNARSPRSKRPSYAAISGRLETVRRYLNLFAC